MRKAANFLLLYFFFCHSVPTSWAKNDSNNTDNEGKIAVKVYLFCCCFFTKYRNNLFYHTTVLTRLTRLEIENLQQKQEIKSLEKKVERHEHVIGKMEKKLKHDELKTEEMLAPSHHLDEEGSSTTDIFNKKKRPARLLPPSILYGYVLSMFTGPSCKEVVKK